MRRFVALLALVAISCNKTAPTTSQPPVVQPAPARQTMTRADFRAKVEGKTKDQVREAVGRPSRTSETSPGKTTWMYNRFTVDPETGKTDGSAWVEFEGDNVKEVIFSAN